MDEPSKDPRTTGQSICQLINEVDSMNSYCIAAVAVFSSLCILESSSAQERERGWDVPAGDTMNARAGLAFSDATYTACYRFTFKLREDSDGIYPGTETVEIEIPGEANPDGTEGSAFVISVPIGGFDRLWTFPDMSQHSFSFNPPGLKVSQYHESSIIFDFVDTDGPLSYPDPGAFGVNLFWGHIAQHANSDGIYMQVRLQFSDNRPGDLQQTPNLVELLTGSPRLRIGDDEWKSYLYVPYSSVDEPPMTPDGRVFFPLDWPCGSLFKARYFD